MGITPQAFLDRPELQPGLDIYLIAYHELLHDRQIGMAVGTIPWSSIHNWAVFHGITDPDDVGVFESHIRLLEKVDKKLEETKPKSGAPKR